MNDFMMPGPAPKSPTRQHQCASSEAIAAIQNAIRAEPEQMARLRDRHILSTRHFDADLFRQLFRLAASYEMGELPGPILRDKILSTVYFDQPGEHSLLAFASAWKRLGGSILDYNQCIDAKALKHYVMDELGEVCNSHGDLVVLRTADEDVFSHDLAYFTVPVINAGNGEDEHPTHAIADLYTLFKWRPDLLYPETVDGRKLQIAIGGNPARTRTIRSFLYALAKFPWAIERVVFLERLPYPLSGQQRRYLEEAGLKLEFTLEEYPQDSMMGAAARYLPEMDVVYLHYLHMIHAIRMNIVDGVSSMKSDALVLNPQIQNEQLARMLNDSPHNGYFAQLRGSVFTKMALFALISGKGIQSGSPLP